MTVDLSFLSGEDLALQIDDFVPGTHMALDLLTV